jgi:hypothetical protein
MATAFFQRQVDGPLQLSFFFISVVRSLHRGRSLRGSAILQASRTRPHSGNRATGSSPASHTKLVHLGHGEEGLPINEQIVLTKARIRSHGGRCVTDNLHDVIPFTRPAVIHNSGTSASVVDFLSVHHNLALSGSDRPHDDNIVFFPATICATSAFIESISVGESKAPIYYQRRVK